MDHEVNESERARQAVLAKKLRAEAAYIRNVPAESVAVDRATLQEVVEESLGPVQGDEMSPVDLLVSARARAERAWNRAAVSGADPDLVAAGRKHATEHYDAVAAGELELDPDSENDYIHDVSEDWARAVIAREAEFQRVGAVDELGRTGREICPALAAAADELLIRIEGGEATRAEVVAADEALRNGCRGAGRALAGYADERWGLKHGSDDPQYQQGRAVGAECWRTVERIEAAVTSVKSPPIRQRLASEAREAIGQAELHAQSPEQWDHDPVAVQASFADRFEATVRRRMPDHAVVQTNASSRAVAR